MLSSLLAPDSPELASLPAVSVIPVGASATFGSLGQSLLDADAFLIGYRTAGRSYLNLDLDEMFTCRDGDELVVIKNELSTSPRL